MDSMETDGIAYAIDILQGWKWAVDDFDLCRVTEADPRGMQPGPRRDMVQIRRKSTRIAREYWSGGSNAWVIAFQRDLLCGRFS